MSVFQYVILDLTAIYIRRSKINAVLSQAFHISCLHCCRIMLTIWVICLLGCLCGGIDAFTKEEWRKELDEMYRRLTAAITTGHYPEELIDHYSDEARILPPGHPIIVGKEGLLQYRREYPEQYYIEIWETKEEEILVTDPDLAIVQIKFTVAGTDHQHVPGKAILILDKENGKAKIRVDMWNFDE